MIVAVAAVAVVVTASCTESQVQQSACSTGPVHTYESVVALPVEDVDSESAPVCVPHCGGRANHDLFLGVEAVPSGACAQGEPDCRFTLQVLCCGGGGGPRHGALCRCRGGTWACVLLRPLGAGVCLCDEDGGSPP